MSSYKDKTFEWAIRHLPAVSETALSTIYIILSQVSNWNYGPACCTTKSTWNFKSNSVFKWKTLREKRSWPIYTRLKILQAWRWWGYCLVSFYIGKYTYLLKKAELWREPPLRFMVRGTFSSTIGPLGSYFISIKKKTFFSMCIYLLSYCRFYIEK